MRRSILIKLSVAFGFLLALGFASGTSFPPKAVAAVLPSAPVIPCGSVSVTTSVYAAVYSHNTGTTSCYSAANIALPEDGGEQYDIVLKAPGVQNVSGIWINQEGHGSAYPWAGSEATFTYLASLGRMINISILPSLQWDKVLIKPISNFQFDLEDNSYRSQDEYYRTNEIPDVTYDIFLYRPSRAGASTRLVNGTGATLTSPLDLQQAGSLNGNGQFVFSNISLGGIKSLFAIVQDGASTSNSDRAYADGTYIGPLANGKGLLKLRFYDYQYNNSQISIEKLDGSSILGLNGIAGNPAPNLLFLWKDMILDYESWEFPSWEHQAKLTITRQEGPAESHTVRVSKDSCSECGLSRVDEYDISQFWTVQLTAPDHPNLANIKVYARNVYFHFPSYAYTDEQGKVTFPNKEEGTYVVSTAGAIDESGYMPRFIQTGPLSGNTLPVIPLKQPTAAPGEAFNLQDAVRLAKQWSPTSIYDFDQSGGAPDLDDLKFLLYLLIPFNGEGTA